jgi:hypothetical protein
MSGNEAPKTGENRIGALLEAGDFSTAWDVAMEISDEGQKEIALSLITDAKNVFILKKIAENKWLAQQVQDHPIILKYLNETSVKIFDFPDYLSVLVEEVLLKEEADNISRANLKKRLQTQPLATDVEISAGVYWENLEPQVKDAIIKLRAKNYNTFESGFDSDRLGAREQYFSITKSKIPLVITDSALEIMKGKSITVRIDNEMTDRDSLIMISNKKMTLGDWTEVWNLLADVLPVREDAPDLNSEHDFSFQRDFQEKQRRLRLGESVYIAYDFWLEDGNLVEK